jgi:uncharacterized protein (TIGR02453 family)
MELPHEDHAQMSAPFPGIPAAGIQFLRDLKQNNHREWFQVHKEIYERELRQPLLELVSAVNAELERFAPEYRTDPPKAAYRIYRDTRFRDDKTPYKTHAAASFAHRTFGKHVAAGYYFHFSPDELLVGGGLWMPGPRGLLSIRQAISSDPQALRSILADEPFQESFGEMTGERLKRPPKGFSAEDPALDLLRFKQFLAGAQLDPALVTAPRVVAEISTRFEAVTPLIRYLNGAIGR